MSSYIKNTRNPKTGEFEAAFWIDDHFGHHHHGVKFADGVVYDPEVSDLDTNDDPVTDEVSWPYNPLVDQEVAYLPDVKKEGFDLKSDLWTRKYKKRTKYGIEQYYDLDITLHNDEIDIDITGSQTTKGHIGGREVVERLIKDLQEIINL